MKSDKQLIQDVREKSEESESLNELINRHSGIYIEIVNRYIREDFGIVRKEDLIQEKDFNIYRCALKFDPSRNTKFSTYLGNETKWMCLNLYNRNKKEKYNQEISETIHQALTPELRDIPSRIDREMQIEINTILENIPDARIKKIFKMRYIVGQKNNVMPWKRICKAVNLSIQGCINVHDKGIKYIKDKLQGELDDK